MRRAAAKHSSWISPRFEEYGPAIAHVGASAAELASLGKAGIDTSDQVIKDLNIPILAQALELLDEVYSIADDLGVGGEVRAGVAAARGAQYASTVLGNYLPALASHAAGSAAISALGAISVVATVVVIAVLIIDLFSSDDEEEAAKARAKRAQARVAKLRQRLTLAGFAAEQDAAAEQEEHIAASWVGKSGGSADQYLASAKIARKFAKLYRTADKRLSNTKRALFESISNIARWQAAVDAYKGMHWEKRDAFDILAGGTSAPRGYFSDRLEASIAGETKKLAAIVRAIQGDQPPVAGGLIGTAVLVGAAGGLLYFLSPGLALGAIATVWTGGKRAAGYVTGKVRGIAP